MNYVLKGNLDFFKRTFFLISLSITLLASAQQLEGYVLDEKNNPIRDVYIFHFAKEHHAHTNDLGYFTLDGVGVGDSIRFSYVGYEKQTLIVKDLSIRIEVKLVESPFEMGEIVINQVPDPLNAVSKIDLELNPVSTSQDILRKVPGLFIGQHAGGGKAEQLFLRGFDIDHGTDVSITVDGMPVNMVSHAHGQGYADLHWLIPETVETIDFGKGPYNAQQGNFATAGYVNFRTKDKLDGSSVTVQGGSFGSARMVGLFDLTNAANKSTYLATEFMYSDGPFESSQNFNRLNLMAKHNVQTADGGNVSVIASHFNSSWTASGQIPQRAVDSGQITRFGSLDDTEGGYTDRTNLALEYSKIINNQFWVTNNAYFSNYNFELYSNFTFYALDSINQDQIRQKENRQIYGFSSNLNYQMPLGSYELLLQGGVGLRRDLVNDVELSSTLYRDSTLAVLQLGDVNEINYFSYLNAHFELGDLVINPGVRADVLQYNYEDATDPLFNPQSLSKVFLSPKLNIIYNVGPNLQVYSKNGIGFHTNDSRVVLGTNEDDDVIVSDNENIVPLAFGSDLGFSWKPRPRLYVNAAAWYLYLEQEFVYVGDAGVVEPSGETRRLGFDLGVRYQLNDWLFFDGDITYAHSRSIEAPTGSDFIPLAPVVTAVGGFNIESGNLSGSLRTRYLRDRPANEDRSVLADGYNVVDMTANYTFGKLVLGLHIQNLLNVEWNETQFETESRIRRADGNLEPNAVSEIHFTPGTPFNLRGSLTYKF